MTFYVKVLCLEMATILELLTKFCSSSCFRLRCAQTVFLSAEFSDNVFTHSLWWLVWSRLIWCLHDESPITRTSCMFKYSWLLEIRTSNMISISCPNYNSTTACFLSKRNCNKMVNILLNLFRSSSNLFLNSFFSLRQPNIFYKLKGTYTKDI